MEKRQFNELKAWWESDLYKMGVEHIEQRRPCRNPACIFSTSMGAAYCCRGCATADEYHYDPDGYHTTGCRQLKEIAL